MAKHFTLAEAEGLLAELSECVREGIAQKAQYEKLDAELEAITHRIMMVGGMQVDRGQILSRKQQRDRYASRLKEAIDSIQKYGCVVKDLDIGLIDFPTLFKGEEVYLCWKLGERRIEFWHGVDEGFPGRKKIDDEFVANHQGDAAQ